MESEVRRMVLLAILVMVAVLAVISCVTGCFARALSQSITDPVNQLVDVVRALNRMDFGRQVGRYLVPGTYFVCFVSPVVVHRPCAVPDGAIFYLLSRPTAVVQEHCDDDVLCLARPKAVTIVAVCCSLRPFLFASASTRREKEALRSHSKAVLRHM